ncbi:MAG: N-acetylmuramoyl-L-alanine amidase [Defluviitaleaceae bacterium]|nr:N-acetylmuramoyl-L-alanine amidase [Defluviitaleaceae bacterium]
MKVYSFKVEQLLIALYVVLIAGALFVGLRAEYVETFAMPVSRKVVLLDPGHGGWDPGKVGDGDVLEKNINLEIALKLQSLLEQGGATVLMTRIEDEALGRGKQSDLRARSTLAGAPGVDIIISIHQNSYPSEKVTGTQVFFYEGSERSRRLAELIQAEVKTFLGQLTNREAQSNSSYYILKQTNIPAVIVECGFLSSPAETRLLVDGEYQERMAWAIYKGILEYFNSVGN